MRLKVGDRHITTHCEPADKMFSSMSDKYQQGTLTFVNLEPSESLHPSLLMSCLKGSADIRDGSPQGKDS